MPTFEYKCKNCEYEWEDIYLTKEDLPEDCPECSGEVYKLVSLIARGIVELNQQEMDVKIKEDVRKMKSKAATDENFRANLVGENKYQDTLKVVGNITDNLSQVKSTVKKSEA